MDNENSSILKPYQKYECWRGNRQFILKTSIGRQLPYIVNFKGNVLQIFDIEWERITHSFIFPVGSDLIDVDYFPTKGIHQFLSLTTFYYVLEGQLGILVGVQDPTKEWGAENYVLALATNSDRPTMRITHSAEVPTKINVVKTLFSCADMAEGVNRDALKLYHKLMEWSHVVAIGESEFGIRDLLKTIFLLLVFLFPGCKDCQCHLAKLTPHTPETEVPVAIYSYPKYLINIMSAFVTDSVLRYTLPDGCYRDYTTSSVYISALSLMPRSRTLLVGLSMGGILAASLNSSNQMVLLELRHERLIRKFAPLEPEDDPDKFEYFIAAVDASPRHPIMIQLWRGSFKTFEEVEEEEKYDRPYFNACLEHKILFGEQWISVNPIVNEREHLMTTRRRTADESQMNISQTFGATANRNSVLLTFERQKMALPGDDPNALPVYIVEAAIFDIDAWYYKRVPGRVSTDGTVLKQCAFLSTIKTNVESVGVSDIGILTLNATDVTRFSSMISDADQLFYPSALSYERVFVAKDASIEWMKIQNIQETIIKKCAAKLPFYITSADSISDVILAAGLVRKNLLSGSPNSVCSNHKLAEFIILFQSAVEIKHSHLTSEQKVLLNLIVYYGRIEEFCQLAILPQIDETLKKDIAEWAIHEAVDFKGTISDKMVALFQGTSVDLSPVAESSFVQGIKLFRVIYEYLKTCSKTLKSTRLHNFAHSIKCMRNHTKLTHQFILYDIIPVDQDRQELMRKMHAERKLEAVKYSSSLPIQAVIRNMERLAPKAQFWNDVPHSEWYPPTPVDLLESLLNVSISERIKRELVVQYVIDWIRSGPEVPDYTERQMAIEVIKVMTNQMLDVDLEKIYYVMDEEKKALRDNSASDAMRALGEKVFSMQNEELTYSKLWGESVPMGVTIKKHDLERFAKRMKSQMEGECLRLPVLDPESEMLYQVFLYENKKFHLMSQEAIQSNDLLRMFMPRIGNKIQCNPQHKTAKELEIQKSVREMFALNRQREEEEMSGVYAAVEEPNERKRPASQYGTDDGSSSVSSAPFVPPTAKRIQQWKKSVEAAAPAPGSPSFNNSSIISQVTSDDPNQNDEINMLIATPARYYKRPIDADLEPELLSPVANLTSPVRAQNSILKTAKGVQSSRGRIRFHESVPRGADESVEAPKGLKLDFAILEDEEEEETISMRKSRTIEIQEEVMEEEQEEEESMEEEQEVEVSEEIAQDEVEEEEEIEVSEEVAQDEEEEEEEECIETEKTFENQEEFEVLEIHSSIEVVTVETTEEVECEPESVEECVEKEEEEENNEDGVIRSSEVQSDDDCEPVEIKETPVSTEGTDELDQEKEKESNAEPTQEVEQTTEIQEEIAIPEAPVESSTTPAISEKTEQKEDAPEPVQTETPPIKEVESSSEVQEEPVVEEAPVIDERPPSRNTRSSSVQRTPAPKPRTRSSSRTIENGEEVDEANTSISSRLRRRSSSRTRSVDTPRSEGRTSRSGSVTRKSVSRAASEEPASTPKRGRPRKVSSTTPSTESRKRGNSDNDDPETPTKRTRRSRVNSLNVIPEAEDEPSTSAVVHSDTPSTSTMTPKRGRGRPPKQPKLDNVVEEKEEEGDEEEEEALNETSLRRSTRNSQAK
ncbi:CBN-MEL-28 protein [Caenorhabditis brenneri]|uniref:CBN-MEL-28 protein n=1 Tax=Caenorhabditis brenneri TaxID=135651 RepID=G0MEG1_CAEBE|nr:CBN-MEL-28 protein [Caenorhabditis brenneri]